MDISKPLKSSANSSENEDTTYTDITGLSLIMN